MSRGFVSPELEAAYVFLDNLVQVHRRSAGKADGHAGFVASLRSAREMIESVDIMLDDNLPPEGQR